MQNEQIFNSVYTGEEMDNAFSVALAIANHNGIPKGTGKGSIQILGMDTNSLTSDGERIPTSAAVANAIAEARKVSELLTFKGVVQTTDDLPADAKPGFVYIVEQEDNENYAWDGVIWTPIGKLIAPIVLSSQSVSYQISDSGDTVPSGEWLIEFPAVQQGKYIWTRTVVQFSVGDPITSYSCAYIGVDGSVAVATVCGVGPDSNANIDLTAEDVGALPTAGGTMTGPINMNSQSIYGLNSPTEDTQAANKGYVDELNDNLADAWTSGKTYAVGDYCISGNQLYRCKADHTSGGTFDSSYWLTANVTSELKNNGIKADLLWTNPYPANSFGAQDVNIDLKEYGYVYIVCRRIKDLDSFLMNTFMMKGQSGVAVGFYGESTITRFINSVSDTAVSFNSARYGLVENNDYGVPFKIYGIK